MDLSNCSCPKKIEKKKEKKVLSKIEVCNWVGTTVYLSITLNPRPIITTRMVHHCIGLRLLGLNRKMVLLLIRFLTPMQEESRKTINVTVFSCLAIRVRRVSMNPGIS
jgi:hypothetical protein